MKRQPKHVIVAAALIAAIGGVSIAPWAFAGRGGGGGGGHSGGGHAGGGNFGGGNPGAHAGGGNFGGGNFGGHSGGGNPGGGNFGGGNFGGGNFSPNTFSRPNQGHAPSFSVPNQFNQQFNHNGGQTFSQHFNGGINSQGPKIISGATQNPTIRNPATNFTPNNNGPKIFNPTNNNLSGQTLDRTNLGFRPTTIGNHGNNTVNNNHWNNWQGGHNNSNNNVIVNKPVIGGGNTNVNNFQNFNNHNFNNQNVNNRNFNNQNYNQYFNHNLANQNNWYHGHWHNNWNNAWYNRPSTWWGGYGYGTGLGYGGYGYGSGYGLAASPWSWGYWNYNNPYYSQPVGGYAGFNYSQPIVVAQAAAPQVANAPVDPNQQQPTSSDVASQLLDSARQSFMRGDYNAALTQTDQAVAQLPNDPVLHEFRGLVLFALQRYKEAAAAEYGVLSVGPGWDWTTLISLYPNNDTYTSQLRALEQYTSENPRLPEARFLLAYQYLTCGHTEDAAAELKAAVQLNPKDQLSAQLLSSLTAPQNGEQPDPNQPAPQGQQPQPAQPIDPATLVGHWSASRPDGSSFALNLAADNTFTWKFTQQDKTQSFNGPYTLENNALTLKQGEQPAMIGQITPLGQNRFNFKLGDNPSDPGLTFTR